MKRFLVFLFILLLIFLFVPLILYFVQFHGTLSKDSNDWSCFSSLLSASIGTIISTITLLILILDRDKSDLEKKTNQFIDYLFRQNDAIIKSLNSENTEKKSLDWKFEQINTDITNEYCNTVIFNYLSNISLSKCPKEVRDYFIFGFSYARKQVTPITTDYFDNTLSDYWKKQAIENAHNRSFVIKNGTSESGTINPSNLHNNIEVINFLKISYERSILQKQFNFTSQSSKYPDEILSFVNTYRYALCHILNYDDGLSLYFSQLSIEQKIFIAFDLISMDKQDIYNKLQKNKKLLSELITKEVKEKNKLIALLYNI